METGFTALKKAISFWPGLLDQINFADDCGLKDYTIVVNDQAISNSDEFKFRFNTDVHLIDSIPTPPKQ